MPSILEEGSSSNEEEQFTHSFQIQSGRGQPVCNYFKNHISTHGQTESLNVTIFHLSLKPHYQDMFVDEVACMYNLPDLHAALADFFVLKKRGGA